MKQGFLKTTQALESLCFRAQHLHSDLGSSVTKENKAFPPGVLLKSSPGLPILDCPGDRTFPQTVNSWNLQALAHRGDSDIAGRH